MRSKFAPTVDKIDLEIEEEDKEVEV